MQATSATRGMAMRSRRPALRRRSRLTPLEVLMLGALAVAIAVTAAFSLRGAAPVEVPSATLRVERSDTLWGIASRHPVPGRSTADSVDYIRRLNGLACPTLTPGQTILVPAEEAPVSVAAR